MVKWWEVLSGIAYANRAHGTQKMVVCFFSLSQEELGYSVLTC